MRDLHQNDIQSAAQERLQCRLAHLKNLKKDKTSTFSKLSQTDA